MEQPPGFVDADNPSHVCWLCKAIYGLKQAPRAWYTELNTFLINIGFKNSLADTSLFVLQNGTKFVYVLVYVDDILVTGSCKAEIQRFLHLLADRFSVKDPEDLNYFLGLEAHRNSKSLHLSQRKYILDILHRYDMQHAKAVSTSMASSPKLTLYSSTSLSNPTEYRKLIGSLQYLAFTRLDIAYAVNKLSQFMHKPTQDHWQAAKRILDISPEHLLRASFSPQPTSSAYTPFLTQIGLEILSTMSLRMSILYTLEATQSRGQQRSKKASIDHPPKLSIVQLQIRHRSWVGSAIYSLNSESPYKIHPSCAATMLV